VLLRFHKRLWRAARLALAGRLAVDECWPEAAVLLVGCPKLPRWLPARLPVGKTTKLGPREQ
jgi:hypothetical protein